VRRGREAERTPKADQPCVRVGSNPRGLIADVQEQRSERNELNERRLSGTASSAVNGRVGRGTDASMNCVASMRASPSRMVAPR
jgi:hypothetical protein